MPLRNRPETIALWNDLDIHFDQMTTRGVPDAALALRGFIAAAEDDDDPIDPSLEAPADPTGLPVGDYIAPIAGTNIGTQLAAYLHRRVWVIGESVPRGAYRDAFAATVTLDQSA